MQVTKQNHYSRNVLWFVLVVIYVLCLLYITLFSRSRSLSRVLSLNLFRSYRLWFTGSVVRGLAILQNIALFVPCGYLFSAVLPSKRSAILAGILLSLAIEIIQYYTGRGSADIADFFNNTIGVTSGAYLYLTVVNLDMRIEKHLFCIGAASLLTAASVIGCIQMRNITGGTSPNVNQFDFRIDSVGITNGLSFSGQCSTYYLPTPEYAIYLKGERTVTAETNINGNTFTAVANVPVPGTYEVLIRFKGFSRVSTATYIKDGNVLYVPAEVGSLPDDPRLEGAILKAYSSAFDTYVYEKGGSLIWLIGYDIEDTTEIILHIDTNEPEKLPENRKEYGFDNLGFHATRNEVDLLGHYRVFVKELPGEYNITGVTVGFNTNNRVIWSHRFRVEDND